jgi:hypothetical protein
MKNKFLLPVLIMIIMLPISTSSQQNQVCLDCHAEAGMTMDKNGKEISITVKKSVLNASAHSKLKCVDCHEGFNPDDIPHKEMIQPVNCKKCHSAPLEKHLFHPQIVQANGYSGSPDVNCKGCHGTHEVMTKTSPTSPTHFANSTNYCGKCHEKEKKQHVKSDHFVEIQHHNPNAPTCIYCHTQKVTANHKLSKIDLKKNQEQLCLTCHLNDKTHPTQFSKTLIDYDNSVHGMAIKGGNVKAAICTDCHGVHDLEKSKSPNSKISKTNVSYVCGQCHKDIAIEYKNSVHGIALDAGVDEAPTCTYCHGEHNINPVIDVPVKMFTNNMIHPEAAVKTQMIHCVKCHSDDEMMKKFGLQTFMKAHEFLPALGKHNETVRCIDCHSSYEPHTHGHDLLPPENVIKKCEQCHSKNSALMAKLYKHEKSQSREKYGFINGTILSDAYVVGTTRNVLLDSILIGLFGLVIVGIIVHFFMRWYFNKGK